MFTEINTKLVEIQGQLRKASKFKKQLVEFEQELKTIEETVSRLRDEFKSEQKDVTKLERISLTNILATLSGTKYDQLRKEKHEMIAAQNRLIEAEKIKTDTEGAILHIREKLQDLSSIENKYRQLLQQKEEMIKISTSPFAIKVFELSELEGTLKAYLTELNEAIVAGNQVKSDFADVIRSLESASNWGMWDMFGGGMISGLAKHQHIGDAENKLHRAQTSMRRFQKELVDVKEQAHIEIDISGMLKFADFFFDGIIVDFIVQDKIKTALNQTKDNYNKIKDILGRLNKQYKENLKRLEHVLKEKQEIVEGL